MGWSLTGHAEALFCDLMKSISISDRFEGEKMILSSISAVSDCETTKTTQILILPGQQLRGDSRKLDVALLAVPRKFASAPTAIRHVRLETNKELFNGVLYACNRTLRLQRANFYHCDAHAPWTRSFDDSQIPSLIDPWRNRMTCSTSEEQQTHNLHSKYAIHLKSQRYVD